MKPSFDFVHPLGRGFLLCAAVSALLLSAGQTPAGPRNPQVAPPAPTMAPRVPVLQAIPQQLPQAPVDGAALEPAPQRWVF